MYFTEKALQDLKREYETIQPKHAALMEAYLGRDYKDERAKEFAQHGFLRRIKSMARSIANVFTLLAPERTSIPSSEERHDAEINIQAFLFNTFAATDNLAWVWIAEKNIRRPDGSEIPHRQIGLRKQRIRESFSADFQAYLQSLDQWFGHLEDFRHALAHRIPLYIPPYMLDPKEAKAYRELEGRHERGDAALRLQGA
jgi:hypothetical protein